MTVLQTRRLTLRPWADSDDDLAFLFDMYSREEVQRYIGLTPRLMQSTDEARERVERWRGTHDGRRGVWGVTLHDGTRLGTVLCKRIPWSADAPEGEGEGEGEDDTEIGWHFHPDAWGRGYASEAATAVLRRAFDAGLDRVVAVTNPANTASQRVCLRIGMAPRGLTTSYYDTTCELFELAAPGRRCVAFFRNVNQGQRGHPATSHLVEAMTDAGFTGIAGFRGNGTVVGTAVGAPAQLAADTRGARRAQRPRARRVRAPIRGGRRHRRGLRARDGPASGVLGVRSARHRRRSAGLRHPLPAHRERPGLGRDAQRRRRSFAGDPDDRAPDRLAGHVAGDGHDAGPGRQVFVSEGR
ncbi:GNAT family N-acetyltransferase [uncultured Microbacterium sp.]|uniref:GNAT family N-acetyltransferase n=1 Tax=uncultured Microbacterium sp. TaxID=191216 RepID=UPI0035CB34D7